MSIRSYISEEMRKAVGAEISRQTSFPVTDSDIRRWAIATYYPEAPPRLFWDAAYAAQTLHRGIVAPEDFNPFAWMAAEARGVDATRAPNPHWIEKGIGIQQPATSFGLNGGNDVEYGLRIRPGDVISSVTTLAEYSERGGRLGLMLFTRTDDIWTNQDGGVVRRLRHTTIRY